MIKGLRSIAVGLLIALFGVLGSAQAVEKPNLLIMGEDADKESVPRSSRIFERVIGAVSDQLNLEGFDVFDETALTLGDFAQGKRLGRTDAELIDIARTISRPPIDVVILFSIYASATELSYTTKIRARIEGRLVNVRTGQRLGNFEVESPRDWNGPKECPRECLLEVVGGHARILANDLGAVLGLRLANLVYDEEGGGSIGIGGAFTIIFDGFTPDDMIDIESYLVVFGGYKNHRPTTTLARYQEIYYESDSSNARLQRNLNKMLDALDIQSRVAFSGNEFRISKIPRRRNRRIDPKDYE
jgi:hypothetical protein